MSPNDILHPPPASMMSAFAEAIYRVYDGDTVIALRVGAANPDLADLLRRHGVSHGGLVTRKNPFGQEQSPKANRAADCELAAAIDKLGLTRLRSDGGSADESWNESGFLVLGATANQSPPWPASSARPLGSASMRKASRTSRHAAIR